MREFGPPGYKINPKTPLTQAVLPLLQQAIAAWPTLMASGLRLGSPAVSVAQDGTRRDSWLGQFMQQVPCLATALKHCNGCNDHICAVGTCLLLLCVRAITQ